MVKAYIKNTGSWIILGVILWGLATTGCRPNRQDCNAWTLCPECVTVVVQCSYDGVDVVSESCPDGCQAKAALYTELCDLGYIESREEVEEGMICEEVVDDE